MHEFSIAQSILEIASNEMKKAKAEYITELELEIGTLAGVEYESLQFALRALTQNTEFGNTKIVIQKPEGRASCKQCQGDFPASSLIIQCPECKGYNCTIIQGKELKVKSIVI